MALNKDRFQEETSDRVRERARRVVGWVRGTQAESGRKGRGERTRVGRSGLHPPSPGGLGPPSSWPRPLFLVSKVPLSEPRLLRPEGPSSWPHPSTRVGLSCGPASFKSRRGHFDHAPRPCPRSPAPLGDTAPASRLGPPTQQLLGQDLVLTPLPTCPVSVPALSSPTSPPRSCRSRRRRSFCRASRW